MATPTTTAETRPDTPGAPATKERLTLAALPGLYADLVKLRLSMMVVLTTGVGVVMASLDSIPWVLLGWTVLGTMLCAASANALNQVIEHHRDLLMNRTKDRPVPSGRISVWHGWVVALVFGYAGATLLAVFVNFMACGLALLTLLLYVLCYTPLKSRTTLNTIAGAVVGAIPPLIGWVAVRDTLTEPAWLLGALLFLWQLPHFLALAWILRDEYANAGFRMLPISPGGEHATVEATLMTTLLLVPLSLLATLIGMTGFWYAGFALAMGCLWSWKALAFFRTRDRVTARRVFLFSLLYLPLLLIVMMLDRRPVLTDDVDSLNNVPVRLELRAVE